MKRITYMDVAGIMENITEHSVHGIIFHNGYGIVLEKDRKDIGHVFFRQKGDSLEAEISADTEAKDFLTARANALAEKAQLAICC